MLFVFAFLGRTYSI